MSGLTVEATGPGRSIVLNAPAKGNALGPAMVEGLIDALAEARADKARFVALRGAGRHFCTGFDLGDPDAFTDEALLHRFVRVETMLQALYRFPGLTVAVVQGRAMGAGADLVAACDRAIASPAARFAFPGPRFGLVLGTARLAARVGAPMAQRLTAGQCTLDARAALAAGLVDTLTDDPETALTAALAEASAVDPDTAAALKRAAQADRANDDAALAALARSAGQPGLADRLRAYLDGLKKRA